MHKFVPICRDEIQHKISIITLLIYIYITWISTLTTMFFWQKVAIALYSAIALPTSSCSKPFVSQAMLKRSRPDRTKQQAYLQGAEVWVLGSAFGTFESYAPNGPGVFPRRFNESWGSKGSFRKKCWLL